MRTSATPSISGTGPCRPGFARPDHRSLRPWRRTCRRRSRRARRWRRRTRRPTTERPAPRDPARAQCTNLRRRHGTGGSAKVGGGDPVLLTSKLTRRVVVEGRGTTAVLTGNLPRPALRLRLGDGRLLAETDEVVRCCVPGRRRLPCLVAAAAEPLVSLLQPANLMAATTATKPARNRCHPRKYRAEDGERGSLDSLTRNRRSSSTDRGLTTDQKVGFESSERAA